MVAVVRNTSQLPQTDRAAMAAYIKSLPPVEGPKPPETVIRYGCRLTAQ